MKNLIKKKAIHSMYSHYSTSLHLRNTKLHFCNHKINMYVGGVA